jgi:hypothetical protein
VARQQLYGLDRMRWLGPEGRVVRDRGVQEEGHVRGGRRWGREPQG